MSYPNVVVTTCRRQASLAVRLKVGRVYGSILIVP
jgi:hypothetical protein